MDVLTFIAKIVESLAWPAIVVGLLLYLRKDFPTMGKALRRLKFKDVEMEFGDAVRELEIETKRAVPQSIGDRLDQVTDEGSTTAKRLLSIAEVSPRAAILEAWLVVEAAAADVLMKAKGPTVRAEAGPLKLQVGLRQRGILTPPQEVVFDHLRRIRNQSLHLSEVDLSPAAVAGYVRSALAIAAYLTDVAGMDISD